MNDPPHLDHALGLVALLMFLGTTAEGKHSSGANLSSSTTYSTLLRPYPFLQNPLSPGAVHVLERVIRI